VKCTDTEIEIGGALSCQRMLALLFLQNSSHLKKCALCKPIKFM